MRRPRKKRKHLGEDFIADAASEAEEEEEEFGDEEEELERSSGSSATRSSATRGQHMLSLQVLVLVDLIRSHSHSPCVVGL